MAEPTGMNIEQALAECGVTDATLTRVERAALDDNGFLLIPGLIDSEWLERSRAAFETAMDRGHGSNSHAKQTGTRHVTDLFGAAEAFDGILTQSKVLAIACHILGGPFRFGQLGGRDPLPGFGQQGLHSDWIVRAPSEPFRVVTVIWLLDHFTADNGATRLVPGTHRFYSPVPKSMADPARHHPDERIVIAQSGSVLAFNGHLWHSGTQNRSNQSRRVLQSQYVARDESRFAATRPAVPERFGPAVRYILGV
jgi:hypothetical protein